MAHPGGVGLVREQSAVDPKGALESRASSLVEEEREGVEEPPRSGGEDLRHVGGAGWAEDQIPLEPDLPALPVRLPPRLDPGVEDGVGAESLQERRGREDLRVAARD